MAFAKDRRKGAKAQILYKERKHGGPKNEKRLRKAAILSENPRRFDAGKDTKKETSEPNPTLLLGRLSSLNIIFHNVYTY